jgi:hypothetical protein
MPPSLVLPARAAFVVACAFTLFVALTPPEAHPLQILPWEKANHLLAFCALAMLGVIAAPRLPLLAMAAGLVGVGALIELLQALPIIHRDPALSDVGIDAAAIVVVLAPVALLRWRAGGEAAPAQALSRRKRSM